ncbi:PDZ and LIM domain protein 3-like [Styela clava]
MPYEVSMSGGQPWGFRLSGGTFAGAPCTISRITPGGKAAQANVMQSDVLIAVNGMSISDLDLHEIMKYIKNSGEEVHLTLMAQEEIEANLKNKRQSEVNFTTATELERPASNMQSHTPRALTPACAESPAPVDALQDFSNLKIGQKKSLPPSPLATTPAPKEDAVAQSEVREQPTPKPRTTLTPANGATSNINQDEVEKNTLEPHGEAEQKEYPDYVKRYLKPQKAIPEFKPQVNWLHGKLKINLKGNPNALSDPGNKLKTAAQAHPNQPIEIEGPLSATVVHAQYNTPVGLYSGNQIVNTLVGTAAAKGAKVPNPDTFCENNIDINKDTPVYKLIHKQERSSQAPAQSRSIQILDALLSTPGATLPSAF